MYMYVEYVERKKKSRPRSTGFIDSLACAVPAQAITAS